MRKFMLAMLFVICFSYVAVAQLNSTQTLSELLGDSDMPALAIEDGSVYSVWRGDIFINGIQQSKVLFRRSADGGVSWRKARNLSDEWADRTMGVERADLRAPVGVDVAAYDGNVYAVWSEHDEDSNGNFEIFGVKSSNFGQSFTPMRGMDSTPSIINTISGTTSGDSLCPSIAAQGNFVYVVWLDNQVDNAGGTGPFRVWYAFSTDGGVSFETPLPIQDLSATAFGAIDFDVTEMDCPQVEVSGSTVILTWVQLVSGSARVAYLRSNNSGLGAGSFEDTIFYIDASSSARKEDLSVSSEGNLIVVGWGESSAGSPFDVKIHYSLNRGVSFSGSSSNIPGDDVQKFPDLDIWDGSVWLALAREVEDQFDVILLRSSDSGATFEEVQNLSSNTSTSIHPAVIANNAVVHAVWMDNATTGAMTTRFRIKYRNSNPADFFDPRVLSQDLGISNSPKIAMSGSNVYAVWKSDETGTGVFGSRILFRRSTDFGITFESVRVLSRDDEAGVGSNQEVNDPAIAAWGNFVVIAWAQRSCPNCPFDIMMLFSEDGGKTFLLELDEANSSDDINLSLQLEDNSCRFDAENEPSSTDDRLYMKSGNDRMPALAMSDKYIYLVWTSDFEGTYDIYYIRWTLGAVFDPSMAPDVTFPPANDPGGAMAECPSSNEDDQSQFLILSEFNENPRQRLSDDLDPFISVNGPVVSIAWYMTSVDQDADIYAVLTDINEGNDFFEHPDPATLEVDPPDRDAFVGDIRCPGVVVFQSRVFGIWSQSVNGMSQIFITEGELNDSGDPDLEDPVAVTETSSHACPTIIRGQNNVYVAWHGQTGGNYEINLLSNPRLDEDDQTFSFSNISNNMGDSEFVSLAMDDNDRLFTVWMDKSSGKPEIFFEADVDVGVRADSVSHVVEKNEQREETSVRLQKRFGSTYTIRTADLSAQSMHIQVFDLQGNLKISESALGNRLTFKMQNSWGRPLANGIYVYVVHIKRADGSVSHSEVKKMLVLR